MPPPLWLGNWAQKSWSSSTRLAGRAALVVRLIVYRASLPVTTQPSSVAPGPVGLPRQLSFQTGAVRPGGAS